MRLRPLALSFAFVLLSTTAACERRVSLGTPCTSASQCNDGLICSFGRCRAGCERQTDCAGAQVCVQEAGQQAVCTLVDDTCEGESRCSAGLVCSVSVCVAPCATMSCVVGSSCQTVDGSEICVRDDITDAGIRMPDASNACMTGTPAGTTTTIDISGIVTGNLTGTLDQRTNEELTVPGASLTRSLPMMISVGLEGHAAWIATTSGDAESVLWEVTYPTDGSALTAIDLLTGAPEPMAIDDVSDVDVQVSGDGFSALFVRRNPTTEAPLTGSEMAFWRLRRTSVAVPIDAITVTEMALAELPMPISTQTVFPAGALFDGLEPLANNDTSAIALALQPNATIPEASGIFLIAGDAPTAPTTLTFPTAWAVPFLVRGTLGALALLNPQAGEVRVAYVSGAGRSTPLTWAFTETQRPGLAAMDITHAVGSRTEFVLATADGCSDALLTAIDCSFSCNRGGSIRVPVSSTANDLQLVALAAGYALIDVSPQGASITWLDADLNIAAARQPLFALNHDFVGDPGFSLARVAVDASASGLYAVALYNRGNDVRLLASAFFTVD